MSNLFWFRMWRVIFGIMGLGWTAFVIFASFILVKLVFAVLACVCFFMFRTVCQDQKCEEKLAESIKKAETILGKRKEI